MNPTVALAQQSFAVEDMQANVDATIATVKRARMEGADLVVFPELSVTGYPPEDLLLRQDYMDAVAQAVNRIADAVDRGIDVIIGAPVSEEGKLFNAALHITSGRVANRYYKRNLPNYGEFDEKRYFEEGQSCCICEVAGCRLGLTVCEDIWGEDIVASNKKESAQCIINLTASPFHVQKQSMRRQILRQRSLESALPVVYVNRVGAQDELVFDGNSMVVNHSGEIIFQAPIFEEGLYLCNPFSSEIQEGIPEVEEVELIHLALTTGLSSYLSKSKLSGLVVGLSGGIDSAVTLTLAVKAVGAEHVEAITMPSPYTSLMSNEDAKQLAGNLDVRLSKLPISGIFEQMKDEISTPLGGNLKPLTLENLQARVRACLLMAYANQKNLMVVSTSNKSEMAVGYSTLYGDMIGGYAPLKDLLKTRVYELAHYYNRYQELIPTRVIERPPSAELAHNQQDTDSLPPYPILDKILERLIEEDTSAQQLVEEGFDMDTVEKVKAMVASSEYKRRQGVPGVKITPRMFGKDRRYPLNYRIP